MQDNLPYKEIFDSSKAGGARWIDQKVTAGNLAQIASAVCACTDIHNLETFTRHDIQQVSSLSSALCREYGKPRLDNKNAANEYDKFISQNLNTLSHAGVLSSKLVNGSRRIYRVENRDVLVAISGDEQQARIFLISYLKWVLQQFNWWSNFEAYINSNHDQDAMQTLKAKFTTLLIDTMKLGSRGSKNPGIEAGRIFAKVVNPIAYAEMIPGIERGRVMKYPPSVFELTYNRPNWRDSANRKPKQLTRMEYSELKEQAAKSSVEQKLKSEVMRDVRKYHNFVAEVPNFTNVKATHVHHIFPASTFPELANVPENMIALTPGQHLGEAHPNGNTSAIDPVYQRTCLGFKLESIKLSIQKNDGMYSYENFCKVLTVGWEIEEVEPTYHSCRKAIVNHIL